MKRFCSTHIKEATAVFLKPITKKHTRQGNILHDFVENYILLKLKHDFLRNHWTDLSQILNLRCQDTHWLPKKNSGRFVHVRALNRTKCARSFFDNYTRARARIDLKFFLVINGCLDFFSLKFEKDPLSGCREINIFVTVHVANTKKIYERFKKKPPTDFFCFSHFQLRMP